MTGPPIHLVVAGHIGQLTGGYLYDARIARGLRALGRTVVVHELAGRFPDADDTARRAVSGCIARVPDGAVLVIDGLTLPAFVPALPSLSRRVRPVALVHHPLAAETGLDEAERAALDRSERAALAGIGRAVATSPTTAAALASMGLPADRIDTVRPGVDRPTSTVPGSGGSSRGVAGLLRLLCIATVTPRKGHLLLAEALAGLTHLPWRLDCIGSVERDPATAAAVRSAVAAAGLEDRFRLLGERPADTVGACYAAADAFVLPSFHEGFGMAFAEALTHGLPVVGTTAGAIPETVPPDAGLLVPPGDAAALREALRRLLTDPELLRSLAAGARRTRFPTWDEAASAFAAALDRDDP
ncbi:MAG: glycosyltransferase family 4 protein [Alphaproteobacteria bacterium]